jgi:hypothetical protein
VFGDRALRLRQAADIGKDRLAPSAAFAGLALPVIAAGSIVTPVDASAEFLTRFIVVPPAHERS